MARQYDSSRRRQAAEQTRERILEAALQLHWEGITEYEPLAREAGCSLPALYKHFPTRESLFRKCTSRFAESLTMPDLTALAAVAEPEQRLEGAVSELCRIHEAMFGYAWTCVLLRDESPALDAELTAYEGLADAITEILALEKGRKAAVIRGLLDFLTYRALRLSAGLSPLEAREELITSVRPLTLSDE
jgi:AcrR family transcriptional regulator